MAISWLSDLRRAVKVALAEEGATPESSADVLLSKKSAFRRRYAKELKIRAQELLREWLIREAKARTVPVVHRPMQPLLAGFEELRKTSWLRVSGKRVQLIKASVEDLESAKAALIGSPKVTELDKLLALMAAAHVATVGDLPEFGKAETVSGAGGR